MKFLHTTSLYEKTLALIFLLVFLLFSVFYTISNLKELRSKFDIQKINLTKKIAHEISYLIDNHLDISPNLSNLIAENTAIYAIVHSSDGSVLARSEGSAIPVGVFEYAESKALKSDFLSLTSFKDPTQRLSITETAIPIFTKNKIKYILRLGFFNDFEENQLSYIKIRNILVFTLIFIVLISLYSIKYFSSLNQRYSLLVSISIIMIILYLSSSVIISKWNNNVLINNFILKECVGQTQLLAPTVAKAVENGNFSELEKSINVLSKNKNFETISIVKDEVYVFNTDISKIGSKISDVYYIKSLNSNVPSVFRHENLENFTVIIPVVNGTNTIASICSVWRCLDKYELSLFLRKKLILIFVFSYLVIYLLVYLLTDEKYIKTNFGIKKEDSSFASNSSNNNIIEKSSLLPSAFIYFSGLEQSLKTFDRKKITESIKCCYEIVRKLVENNSSVFVDINPEGIFVLFKEGVEEDRILECIDFANSFIKKVVKSESLLFNPKVTLNISDLLYIENEKIDNKPIVAGNYMIDFKTISKIQSNNEIVISEQYYDKIKDIANFETLEILSAECGKFKVYVIESLKENNELKKISKSSSEWTKSLITHYFDKNTKIT